MAILLGGCTVTSGVNVGYQPQAIAPRVAETQAPPVKVYVTDRRFTRSVSQSTNTFGMVTANVEARNSVSGALKDAFNAELHNRGFVDGEDGNMVSVTLRNFENQYTPGLLSKSAAGRMDLEVIVKRPDGSVAYDKRVTGEGKSGSALGGGLAQHALNAAMQDAVTRVFNDPQFIAALNNH